MLTTTRAVSRLLAVAALLVFGSSCAARVPRSSLTPVEVERLYFGRDIADTGTVSDSAWSVFVKEVVMPAFPDGATVWETAGYWRAPDGKQVRERGFALELMHGANVDVESRIERVIEEYKKRFAQQAVLRIHTTGRTNLPP